MHCHSRCERSYRGRDRGVIDNNLFLPVSEEFIPEANEIVLLCKTQIILLLAYRSAERTQTIISGNELKAVEDEMERVCLDEHLSRRDLLPAADWVD